MVSKIERTVCEVHTVDLISLWHERDHRYFCQVGTHKNVVEERELDFSNRGALDDFIYCEDGIWRLNMK